MNKLQSALVAGTIALFFLMYFGCDTKPQAQQAIEKTRALNAKSTDISTLLHSAKESITELQRAEILGIEAYIAELAEDDATRTEGLKRLSGKWFEFGHPEVAGHYAEEIATSENTEPAWAIAGTTYTLCIQKATEDKIREFCTEKAIAALENAISIDPSVVANQVNLALVHVENPPKDNPMQGILSLRGLNEAHPENVSVLYNLGRFGIRVGKFDSAVKRLESALAIEPNNRSVICLLSQAYNGLGNAAKAKEFEVKCQSNG